MQKPQQKNYVEGHPHTSLRGCLTSPEFSPTTHFLFVSKTLMLGLQRKHCVQPHVTCGSRGGVNWTDNDRQAESPWAMFLKINVEQFMLLCIVPWPRLQAIL